MKKRGIVEQQPPAWPPQPQSAMPMQTQNPSPFAANSSWYSQQQHYGHAQAQPDMSRRNEPIDYTRAYAPQASAQQHHQQHPSAIQSPMPVTQHATQQQQHAQHQHTPHAQHPGQHAQHPGQHNQQHVQQQQQHQQHVPQQQAQQQQQPVQQNQQHVAQQSMQQHAPQPAAVQTPQVKYEAQQVQQQPTPQPAPAPAPPRGRKRGGAAAHAAAQAQQAQAQAQQSAPAQSIQTPVQQPPQPIQTPVQQPAVAATPIPVPTPPAPIAVPAQSTPTIDHQTTPQGGPVKKSRTNTPWTPAEELRLKQMRDAGQSWAEIAKVWKERTPRKNQPY